MIPLVLALVALIGMVGMVGTLSGGNRYHARFFAAAFLLSILLAFDTPLLRLLFEVVPGFSLFRHPSRLLFLTTLCGIPLSAIGLEMLLDRVTRRMPEGRTPRVTTAVVALLILIVSAEGSYYARRYLEMAPSEKVIPRPHYARFLAADPSLFRVAPIGRSTLNYGWGSFFQLELITGFDAYNYRHYERYIGLLTRGEIVPEGHVIWTDVNRIARLDLLDALNVKYVLTTRKIAAPPPQLVLVKELLDEPAFVFYQGMTTTPIYIYENQSVLPRSYFATELTPARDAQHALELALGLDLRETTIVEGPDTTPVQLDVGENAALRFVERKSDHYLLETHNQARGFAVVGEIWHPGWRATLDAEPITLQRTNIAQMGAWIPAGEHQLRLQFRPLYWSIAKLLSMAGTAGLIAVAWLALRSRSD
ncbi:MAG: hypothetical protein JRG94_18220 [Deltaproteobacteria bacterium]|nr:hypothetical protein [Deltaproteobacteria bacterium]